MHCRWVLRTMKKILIVATLFGFAAIAADRVVTAIDSTVTVTRVELSPLPDGGCAVVAYATFQNAGVTLPDGGPILQQEGTRAVEVAGANRTTCLDILNNKAPVLFRSDRGF